MSKMQAASAALAAAFTGVIVALMEEGGVSPANKSTLEDKLTKAENAVAEAKGGKGKTKPATDAAAATLDYEKDVKPVALKLSQDKGRDGLVSLLKKFDAETTPKLKPEQYAEFIKAAHAVMAGQKAEATAADDGMF